MLSLSKKLESWTKSSKNTGLTDFFEMLIRESGFLEHIIASDSSAEKLIKLDRLFTEIKDLSLNHKEFKLHDFIEYLDILEEHNIVVRTKGKRSSIKAVHLMTAHKSKGLEFDSVYIVNAFFGHWGNKREMRKFKLPLHSEDLVEFESIDDERRLFYVALTRARKEAVISYAKQSEDGKQLLPSQFVGELAPELVKEVDTKHIEEKYERNKLESFLPGKDKKDDLKDKEYLRKVFFEQGLSVTALNNYLSCPWRYFFSNLIRLPQAMTKHQSYGIAVHSTLKHFFDRYKEEKDMSKKELLDLFGKYLSKQPMNKADFEDTLIKGKTSLGGYFDAYAGTWVRSIVNEFNISGVFIELPEKEEKVLVRGSLDKIEISKDGVVNVVDYKTKKPMTRNDIEGKTKNSDGNYKRQLVFYKMLLDKYSEGKNGYIVETGELDFIEPDQKGKYKKEKFSITDDDVKELVLLIQKSASEIANFDFWDKECDEKDCEYCRLRKIMKI
ncbi:MAG: PD-(D/E)XK nuclease family protein, partial [Candidatus Paceibacterota bacterium]